MFYTGFRNTFLVSFISDFKVIIHLASHSSTNKEETSIDRIEWICAISNVMSVIYGPNPRSVSQCIDGLSNENDGNLHGRGTKGNGSSFAATIGRVFPNTTPM